MRNITRKLDKRIQHKQNQIEVKKMKQTLILCDPNPLYVCKRNADCKGTRKTKHCSKECFYTLDKKLAIDPNAYYACINPSDEEGKIMLIREDKLKNFNLIRKLKVREE